MADENKTNQQSLGPVGEQPEASCIPSPGKVPPSLPADEELQPTGHAHALKLPPELLEWARQLSSVEEVLADLRALREQGSGHELDDFLRELEQLVPQR